jgi:hypothetical protein
MPALIRPMRDLSPPGALTSRTRPAITSASAARARQAASVKATSWNTHIAVTASCATAMRARQAAVRTPTRRVRAARAQKDSGPSHTSAIRTLRIMGEL